MTEEVLIEVKLEENNADFAKLSQLKTSLDANKQAQKDLASAYKSTNITQKEFYDQTVKLEAEQKKIQAAYGETQRKVTGLKSPFHELKEAIKEQSKEVEVGGLSLKTFLNPVTATVGILAALTEAYENSTIGAKDLEFVHSQLAATTHLLSNELAKTFSSAEDGEGFLTKAYNTLLESLGPAGLALAGATHAIALTNEQLEELHRKETEVRADISDRLEENQGKLSEIGREQTSLNDKVRLYDEIIDNLKHNQKDIVSVKQKELDIAQQVLDADKDNEDKQQAVLDAQKDLNRESSRAEKLIQAQIRAQDNLLDAEKKRLGVIKEQNKLLTGQALRNITDSADATLSGITSVDNQEKGARGAIDPKLSDEEKLNQQIQDLNQESNDNEQKSLDESNKNLQEYYDKRKAMAQQASSLFTQNFNQQLQTQNDFAKAFLKSFLITSLSMIKTELEARIFGGELARLGFPAGLVTGALGAAAVEGLFQAASSTIQGFDQGGIIGHEGVPVRRSNGDNVLITAKSGEVILNDKQQSYIGEDMLKAAGVPGFDLGGRVYDNISTKMINQYNNQQLYRSIRNQQIVLVAEDYQRVAGRQVQVKQAAQF